MRGSVLGAQVGLDLDDPDDPRFFGLAGAAALANQECAEQGCRRVERGAGEPISRKADRADRQSFAQDANTSRTAAGKTPPRTARMDGTTRSRMISAVTDPFSA